MIKSLHSRPVVSQSKLTSTPGGMLAGLSPIKRAVISDTGILDGVYHVGKDHPDIKATPCIHIQFYVNSAKSIGYDASLNSKDFGNIGIIVTFGY
jgi:hypothetical protein